MKNESKKEQGSETPTPQTADQETIKKWVTQDIKAAIVLLDTIVNDPAIFDAIVLRLREIKTQAEEFVNKNK